MSVDYTSNAPFEVLTEVTGQARSLAATSCAATGRARPRAATSFFFAPLAASRRLLYDLQFHQHLIIFGPVVVEVCIPLLWHLAVVFLWVARQIRRAEFPLVLKADPNKPITAVIASPNLAKQTQYNASMQGLMNYYARYWQLFTLVPPKCIGDRNAACLCQPPLRTDWPLLPLRVSRWYE